MENADLNVAHRIAYLSTLHDGWLDGEGIAPGAHALATAFLVAPQLDSAVSIFPHPEGGVLLEWGQDGPVVWSLEITRNGSLMHLHGAHFSDMHDTTVWDDSGVEATFTAVEDVVAFVHSYTGSGN